MFRTLAATVLVTAIVVPHAALAQASADQRFTTLATDHWEWYAREVPEYSTLRGDNRYNDRLIDQSPGAVRARKAHWVELLKQLQAFDPSGLSVPNRVSLQVLTAVATNRTRIDRFFADAPYGAADSSLAMGWSPVTQMYGPQFVLPLLVSGPQFA